MTPLLRIYVTLLYDRMSMLFLSWCTILRNPTALPDRADEMTREGRFSAASRNYPRSKLPCWFTFW